MGMDVFMEFTVRKIFKSEGRVSGCFAYSRNDGSLHVFKAKSIVLATGGATRCWEICSDLGSIQEKVMHWHTGQEQKWEIWNLFSSIQQG